MIDRDGIVRIAVQAFDQIETGGHWNNGERLAARSAVRVMMVRLGLYHEFCEALQDAAPCEVVGYRSDGSPIHPYAPGGGPI